MADKLDNTPDENHSSEDLKTIVSNLPAGSRGGSSKTVDRGVYELLLEDRPMKLTEEQAGFKRGGGSEGGACGGCAHFYTNKALSRNVCEMVRTSDDSNIEAGDVCKFQTPDLEVFPLLSSSKSPERRKASPGSSKDDPGDHEYR